MKQIHIQTRLKSKMWKHLIFSYRLYLIFEILPRREFEGIQENCIIYDYESIGSAKTVMLTFSFETEAESEETFEEATELK